LEARKSWWSDSLASLRVHEEKTDKDEMSETNSQEYKFQRIRSKYFDERIKQG